MRSENSMGIGERIKQKRLSKGFTQQKLADELGKSLSTIKKYESGMALPPIDVLTKISNVLRISSYDLLPYDENWKDEERVSYLDTEEFKTISGSRLVQQRLNEKNNIIMPLIKYVNDYYLLSQYDIEKIFDTTIDNFLNNTGNYMDLEMLLVDIIKIRLERYRSQKNR